MEGGVNILGAGIGTSLYLLQKYMIGDCHMITLSFERFQLLSWLPSHLWISSLLLLFILIFSFWQLQYFLWRKTQFHQHLWRKVALRIRQIWTDMLSQLCVVLKVRFERGGKSYQCLFTSISLFHVGSRSSSGNFWCTAVSITRMLDTWVLTLWWQLSVPGAKDTRRKNSGRIRWLNIDSFRG